MEGKNGEEPVRSDAEQSLIDQEREDWIDKVFKVLLPQQVYERARHSNFEKFVRNYLIEHEIAVAQNGDKTAILREGKIFATWEPTHKKNYGTRDTRE